VFSTTTISTIFFGAISSGANTYFCCMKIVENILSRIGISQRSLASLVNTNHSLLSRYEAALGSLPVPVMLELANIYTQLVAQPTVPAPTPTAEHLSDMQRQATYCQAMAERAQQQLKTMQLQYQQAGALLQLVDTLDAAPEPKTVKRQRWIDELRYQANKKIAANGWLPQQQLQLKIQLLQTEMAFYNNQ